MVRICHQVLVLLQYIVIKGGRNLAFFSDVSFFLSVNLGIIKTRSDTVKNTGQEFMQKTKAQNLSESDQKHGFEQPPLEKSFDGEMIELPSIETLPKQSILLDEAIMQRKTLRKYSENPITTEELSYLIYQSQGIKVLHPQATKRTVPSAGARHAFDLYLLINNVKGIEEGLYLYIPSKHALGIIKQNDSIKKDLELACFNQVMISSSAVTFILAANIYRMSYRYVERGYRYIHLDAGHVVQNLYLTSEAINAGTCAIAAFNDDAVNEVLSLDGTNEFAVYLATIGKK